MGGLLGASRDRVRAKAADPGLTAGCSPVARQGYGNKDELMGWVGSITPKALQALASTLPWLPSANSRLSRSLRGSPQASLRQRAPFAHGMWTLTWPSLINPGRYLRAARAAHQVRRKLLSDVRLSRRPTVITCALAET